MVMPITLDWPTFQQARKNPPGFFQTWWSLTENEAGDPWIQMIFLDGTPGVKYTTLPLNADVITQHSPLAGMDDQPLTPSGLPELPEDDDEEVVVDLPGAQDIIHDVTEVMIKNFLIAELQGNFAEGAFDWPPNRVNLSITQVD